MSTERPGDSRPVDDAVDQAWREASTDGPSARVDAAILAAARAEVARKPAAQAAPNARGRRDWWTGWQPLAAAATVAGLAFILVQTIPRDQEVAPSAPAAEGATRTEAAESSEVQGALEAPPATKSNEAAAPPATGSPAAVEADAAAEADTGAGARYRAAAPTPSTAAVPAPAPAPGDWATRIESLYDAGDLASAAAELRAFRAEYEDADRHLPDPLREWAASVK